MEFNYPNLHTLVSRDFEAACKRNPSINRLRLRGMALFKDVNVSSVEAMYPDVYFIYRIECRYLRKLLQTI